MLFANPQTLYHKNISLSFYHTKSLKFYLFSTLTYHVLFRHFDAHYINVCVTSISTVCNTVPKQGKRNENLFCIAYIAYSVQMDFFSIDFSLPALGKNFKFISNFSHNHDHCFHPFTQENSRKKK